MRPFAAPLAVLLALAACHAGERNIPGDGNDHRPFSGIAADERLRFTGSEPFWGGEVAGGTLTYRTPETPAGQVVPVSRFAGRGGLSFSGVLDGANLLIVFTPGNCSDGMSDRIYPFVATLQLGEETRQGCAWSDKHPFREGKAS